MVFEAFPVLEKRKTQLASTLSGGEQQMLAIGRTLIAGPRLLMLDEPSMGLAPILVQKVFDVVKEIGNKGVDILLVEQNVYQSLEIADRAYVLENGEITLEGPASELLESEKIKKAYLGI
jgi:branched-chain amino acid transport system ATP-binding protein